MFASIRKFSKSFIAKIFIAIIALPFIMWGMGDVFRSGNQNVLVEINDNKINTKDFVNYLQKINLSDEQAKELSKSNLINNILSNYISEKIIEIESNKKGIMLSDEGLKEILLSDKSFYKDGKFSRVKYEKYLLENGYTAPTYEKYLKGLEIKAQLLNYYSGGIKTPKFITKEIYKKENVLKEIQFIDLNKIYSKKKIEEKDIQNFYEKNKSFFNEQFISFRYLTLSPINLTKKDDFDEEYFEKLDELENKILDGNDFDNLIDGKENNIKSFDFLNARKTKRDGSSADIDDLLFNKIFSIKQKRIPEIITINNKYFLVEITEKENIILNLKDKDLRKTINAQLNVRYKIEENNKLREMIDGKKFDKNQMLKLAKDNNLEIKNLKIQNINDNKQFDENLIKKIYSQTSGDIFLVTDEILSKNFLIRIVSEIFPEINENSDNFKKYIKRANNQYVANIYSSYDKLINSKYKIDINQKVLERLKNSF